MRRQHWRDWFRHRTVPPDARARSRHRFLLTPTTNGFVLNDYRRNCLPASAKSCCPVDEAIFSRHADTPYRDTYCRIAPQLSAHPSGIIRMVRGSRSEVKSISIERSKARSAPDWARLPRPPFTRCARERSSRRSATLSARYGQPRPRTRSHPSLANKPADDDHTDDWMKDMSIAGRRTANRPRRNDRR